MWAQLRWKALEGTTGWEQFLTLSGTAVKPLWSHKDINLFQQEFQQRNYYHNLWFQKQFSHDQPLESPATNVINWKFTPRARRKKKKQTHNPENLQYVFIPLATEALPVTEGN